MRRRRTRRRRRALPSNPSNPGGRAGGAAVDQAKVAGGQSADVRSWRAFPSMLGVTGKARLGKSSVPRPRKPYGRCRSANGSGPAQAGRQDQAAAAVFAGRNSLLAGNLAGILQNRAESGLFGLPALSDCEQYQDVGVNSLVRGKQEISATKQEFLEVEPKQFHLPWLHIETTFASAWSGPIRGAK